MTTSYCCSFGILVAVTVIKAWSSLAHAQRHRAERGKGEIARRPDQRCFALHRTPTHTVRGIYCTRRHAQQRRQQRRKELTRSRENGADRCGGCMGESTLDRTPQDFPTSFRLGPRLAHVLVALICVARGLATWPPRSPGPELHQSLRSRLPHTLCVWAAVSDASCVCFLLAGIVLLGDLLDPPPRRRADRPQQRQPSHDSALASTFASVLRRHVCHPCVDHDDSISGSGGRRLRHPEQHLHQKKRDEKSAQPSRHKKSGEVGQRLLGRPLEPLLSHRCPSGWLQDGGDAGGVGHA